MKLRKNDDQWSWVNFKYEGVPTFCFICGLIGHIDKFCEKLFETPEELIARPFGAWMRVEPRRKNYTLGAKWLRPEGDFPAASSVEGERPIKGKVVTEIIGIADSRGEKEGMMIDSSNGDKEINLGVNQGSGSNSNRAPKIQNIINYNNNIMHDKIAEVEVTELPIVDPKRRRINDVSDKNSEEITGQEDDNIMEIQDGSKNVIMAGVVQQPRLAL
ncbi:hypothetical protein POM88_043934 [Heracleum sosnowskyi]|uniref:Zinc knuckle CX2CX4HX4C domain-containing protein n=1 Tax=Heracleum sosnowskyi TaxID=360622 RepID=A0AAD8M2F7_9APIA|nr:hypothetical protein POM88_043934 [Heracleum sosnowskyi]